MSRARFIAGLTCSEPDDVSAILRAIARQHQISADDILGWSRRKAIVRARWDFWAALYCSGFSVSAIGNRLGRDHTTILYGLRGREDGQ